MHDLRAGWAVATCARTAKPTCSRWVHRYLRAARGSRRVPLATKGRRCSPNFACKRPCTLRSSAIQEALCLQGSASRRCPKVRLRPCVRGPHARPVQVEEPFDVLDNTARSVGSGVS